MNDRSGPAAQPGMRASRNMSKLSLFCIFAGIAAMIGGLFVRSTSVIDEMSASANLVIPGEFAVMSDGEFVRSLLPAAVVAGIVHLVGVVAGLMGRTRAEDRRELARGALGVGANTFFLACACITPVVGIVGDPGGLVPVLVVCCAAAMAVCCSLFRPLFDSAAAMTVGAGAASLLAMVGALLVGFSAMLHDLAMAPGDPFLPGLIVVAVCFYMSVPVGIVQLMGVIAGIRARRRADSESKRALATRGILLNLPLCWCVLFLPLVVLAAIS